MSSRDLYPTLWWSPRKKARSKKKMTSRGSWALGFLALAKILGPIQGREAESYPTCLR